MGDVNFAQENIFKVANSLEKLGNSSGLCRNDAGEGDEREGEGGGGWNGRLERDREEDKERVIVRERGGVEWETGWSGRGARE